MKTTFRNSEGELQNSRCPQCGKFLGADPDGFWDAEDKGGDDSSYMTPFCDEACADKFHGRVAAA